MSIKNQFDHNLVQSFTPSQFNHPCLENSEVQHVYKSPGLNLVLGLEVEFLKIKFIFILFSHTAHT